MLYPGERATPTNILVTETDDGGYHVVPVDWVVEPMPGWYGWWLRFDFQFLSWVPFRHREPKIDATVSIAPQEQVDHDD